jgi:hypothetical protein
MGARCSAARRCKRSRAEMEMHIFTELVGIQMLLIPRTFSIMLRTKILTFERPCCIKIRLNTELKRSEFNAILRSTKRTLERHERTGELSMVPSQQGIEVQVEPLTEQSEKFLSPVQDVFGPRGNNGFSLINRFRCRSLNTIT